MFEALLASPIAAAGLMAIGFALTWLAFLIGRSEGRDAGRREAPRLALTYVVREVAIDSAEAAQEFAKQTRDRNWVN